VSGVPVGTVESIELNADGRTVAVTTRILKKFTIYADARFEVEQSGFLGDQFVSVVPTKNEKEALKDGAVVRAAVPFNLQEAARSAMGLMQKLDTAVDRVNGAVARVDKVLLSEQVLTNLAATAVSFRRVSERAEVAIGDVQAVVATNGPLVGLTFSNLNTLSLTLSTTASNLQSTLDTAKPDLQAALHSAADATADLKSLTGDLQAGKGMAGAALKDEALRGQFGEMIGNLTTVSSNLARFGLLYKPKSTVKLTNDTLYTGRGPGR
jgi:ABC-type transporter Mla subunit MlaD